MSSGPARASSASPIVVGSPRSTISAPRGWWRSTVGPSAAACSTFRRSRHSSSAGSRARPCRARPAGRLPSRSPSVPGGPRHGRREARSRRFDSSSSSLRRRKTGQERLARPGPRTRRAAAVDEGDRLQIGPVGIVPPALCLWRPPTDNDDPPGEWHRRESAADRWRGWGLDRIEASAVEHRREGTDHVSTTTYELAVGNVIHRQRRRVLDGAIEIVDDVTIPEVLDDLPRVGVRFELPAGFDTLEWFGFGPGDSYPDRRAATTLGRWRDDVGEQAMPFIVPQEYGLHVDTRWFRIGDGATTLEVTPAVPLAFSALPYRAEDLTAATHAHQLTHRPVGGDVRSSRCRPSGPGDRGVRPRHRRPVEDPGWHVPVDLAVERLDQPVSRPARRTRRATPSRRRSDRRACAG